MVKKPIFGLSGSRFKVDKKLFGYCVCLKRPVFWSSFRLKVAQIDLGIKADPHFGVPQ